MAEAAIAGIWDLPIATMPVAVIDFETTGLSAGFDRVVEVAVVRLDPGEEPRLVIDSLVHPERMMDATFVHGLADADVASAPKFADIAGLVVEAIVGCVVAAYNVGFDIQFLRDELRRVGLKSLPPQLCLMYLRPMLGFGPHCKLAAACRALRVPYRPQHTAASDAWAAAGLWQRYQQALDDRGVVSFRDLADLRGYRFVESFRSLPLSPSHAEGLLRGPLQSRMVPSDIAEVG